MLRCIRAIAGDAFTAGRAQQQVLKPPLFNPHFRRHASRVATDETDHWGGAYLNDAQRRHYNQENKNETTTMVENGAERRNRIALEKELVWLKDPLALSDHVRTTLQDGKIDKALELCRLASKSMDCVVAWNRLVEWHMQEGAPNQALKVYNEMKKRAQFPDSYTYIFLLRGLAPQTVADRTGPSRDANAEKAVTIYNSMKSPTSRVKPSILHTNAALKVCSFSTNLDAFWGILAGLPSHGYGAADHMTYTLILDAIRHEVNMDANELEPRELSARKSRATNHGRKVWEEIIDKWRAGEVVIDERLVSAMARLLLISEHIEDWDDVLNLVRQTMNVQRLLPPLGTKERHIEHLPKPTSDSPDEGIELSLSDQVAHDAVKDTPAAKAFNPVKPLLPVGQPSVRSRSVAYATPSTDTLSVILEACTLMRTPKTAWAYWELFVNEYGVEPDLNNLHAHLRLLSINRSSAKAVELITKCLKGSSLRPRKLTFRMALTACLRNTSNEKSLDHARQIVNAMETTLADLDARTLGLYLKLAVSTGSGPKIVDTLNRLDSCANNLRSRFLYGAEPTEWEGGDAYDQDRADTIQLFQQMVSAIDRLMNRGLVPRESFILWHARRSQLMQIITRSKSQLENYKASRGDGSAEGDDRRDFGIRKHSVGKLYRTYDADNHRPKSLLMSKGSWSSRRPAENATKQEKIKLAVREAWKEYKQNKSKLLQEVDREEDEREKGKKSCEQKNNTGNAVRQERAGDKFMDSPSELAHTR